MWSFLHKQLVQCFFWPTNTLRYWDLKFWLLLLDSFWSKYLLCFVLIVVGRDLESNFRYNCGLWCIWKLILLDHLNRRWRRNYSVSPLPGGSIQLPRLHIIFNRFKSLHSRIWKRGSPHFLWSLGCFLYPHFPWLLSNCRWILVIELYRNQSGRGFIGCGCVESDVLP